MKIQDISGSKQLWICAWTDINPGARVSSVLQHEQLAGVLGVVMDQDGTGTNTGAPSEPICHIYGWMVTRFVEAAFLISPPTPGITVSQQLMTWSGDSDSNSPEVLHDESYKTASGWFILWKASFYPHVPNQWRSSAGSPPRSRLTSITYHII